LEARPLQEASAWIAEYRKYWESSFRELDGLLEELKASAAATTAPRARTKNRRKRP
jgi:hypothetical protein